MWSFGRAFQLWIEKSDLKKSRKTFGYLSNQLNNAWDLPIKFVEPVFHKKLILLAFHYRWNFNSKSTLVPQHHSLAFKLRELMEMKNPENRSLEFWKWKNTMSKYHAKSKESQSRILKVEKISQKHIRRMKGEHTSHFSYQQITKNLPLICNHDLISRDCWLLASLSSSFIFISL